MEQSGVPVITFIGKAQCATGGGEGGACEDTTVILCTIKVGLAKSKQNSTKTISRC